MMVQDQVITIEGIACYSDQDILKLINNLNGKQKLISQASLASMSST